MELRLTVREDSVRLDVRVQPRSSISRVDGVVEGALRVRLAAPPVDGEANEELVRFLASVLRIPRSRIRIVRGLSSRNKTVEIEGADAYERLEQVMAEM